jgi:hypothetical protein
MALRSIELTQGKHALIDEEDYVKVGPYKWCYSSSNGYAVSRRRVDGVKEVLLMHRLVHDTPKGLITDHINHDKLDNRRENLRTCTRHENNRNMPLRSNNKSGYKGVYWHAARGKWQANIRHCGEEFYLGLFTDKHEAAEAYNRKAVELFGVFASLNVIMKEAA